MSLICFWFRVHTWWSLGVLLQCLVYYMVSRKEPKLLSCKLLSSLNPISLIYFKLSSLCKSKGKVHIRLNDQAISSKAFIVMPLVLVATGFGHWSLDVGQCFSIPDHGSEVEPVIWIQPYILELRLMTSTASSTQFITLAKSDSESLSESRDDESLPGPLGGGIDPAVLSASLNPCPEY